MLIVLAACWSHSAYQPPKNGRLAVTFLPPLLQIGPPAMATNPAPSQAHTVVLLHDFDVRPTEVLPLTARSPVMVVAPALNAPVTAAVLAVSAPMPPLSDMMVPATNAPVTAKSPTPLVAAATTGVTRCVPRG